MVRGTRSRSARRRRSGKAQVQLADRGVPRRHPALADRRRREVRPLRPVAPGEPLPHRRGVQPGHVGNPEFVTRGFPMKAGDRGAGPRHQIASALISPPCGPYPSHS
jgi:hypothetical protein